MKEKVWDNKYSDKMGEIPQADLSKKENHPKNRKEQTEGQHKSKPCLCGIHSVRGHKQKWKYPKWKKKSRKLQEKT